MKGDFTRQTFNARDHFNRVLMQQGRVMMDADWNEQEAIEAYLGRAQAHDVIGPCGAPQGAAGFEITESGGALLLGAGRYYVDGILCENEGDAGKPIAYAAQPDLPNPPDALADVEKTGFAIAYLDVWERHVTALDVPRLREVALNGPDTMTRVRTVWQVRLLPVSFKKADVGPQLAKLVKERLELLKKRAEAAAAGDQTTVKDIDAKLTEINTAIAALQAKAADAPSCDMPFSEWDALTTPAKRTLTASAAAVAPNSDPCVVPAGAGYRGLENQLYRVEVHVGGGVGAATFKWSRDNGTVVSLIEKISGKEITVADLGRDDVLTFKAGDWVEVSDDALELNGQPGKLYQVDTVKAATRVVVLKTAATKLDNAAPAGVNPALKPKLRKWDQQTGATNLGVPIANNADIALEDGVQVRFAANGDVFKTGDYWLVPARVATGDIEWPRDATPQKAHLALPPMGIQHHVCRLALISLNPATGALSIEDCRNHFPPLTDVCARPRVMRVVAVNWDNDGGVPKDFEKTGLRITLDTPPDPASVNGNSVIVSAEVPFVLGGQVETSLSQCVTLAGQVGVDPADARTIVWTIGRQAGLTARPSAVFSTAAGRAGFSIKRVNVTLKGALIWSAHSDAADRVYLDGRALGLPVAGDDRVRTGLRLPSGCCDCASDFEGWMTVETERKTATLIVKEIRLIGSNPASAPPGVIGTVTFPPAPSPQAPALTVNAGAVITALEVVFSRAVVPDGLKDPAFDKHSLGVEFLATVPPQRLTGGLSLIDDTTARFNLDPVQRKTGAYRLTVLGVDGAQPFGGPAVRAVDDKSVLDGEYDNTPGGSFSVQFQIVAQRGVRAARRR